MNFSYSLPQFSQVPWQILYRPMLFVSLGLHGLLLFLPLPSQPEPQAEPTAAEPEQLENIKIEQLLSTPKKVTPPKPTPQLLPPQVPPAPTLIAPPPPAAAPIPQPEAQSPPESSASEPATESSAEATPAEAEPADTAPVVTEAEGPDTDPNVSEGALQSFLGQVQANDMGVPDFLFAQPELFFTKLSSETEDEPELKPEIATVKWISLKTPEQVFEEALEPGLKSSGFEVSQRGEYGGGIVYELKKDKLVRYLNLLATNDKTGTLVVVWNQLPD